jgi:CRISPR-associated protein Cmr3
MLPAPSIFAGAFRSFLASRKPSVLTAIMAGNKPAETDYAKVLGSLAEPGTFRITRVSLCEKKAEQVRSIFPLPSDIVVFEDKEKDEIDIRYLVPQNKPALIDLGSRLPKVPLLKAPSRKPAGGFWLAESGYGKYLAGQMLEKADLKKESELWGKEMRVGIGLNSSTRTVEESMLYTAEAVSFKDDMGFLVEVAGAEEVFCDCGDLSLGGDQRAAHFSSVTAVVPVADLQKIAAEKRFKLLLTSPAIFADGWLPENVLLENGGFYLKLNDFKAKLVCASIKGYETLSGWNMVKKTPKTAMKTVPAGSVYWFEDITGDINNLKTIIETGLWASSPDKQRLAEGYNRVEVAAYEIK